MTAVVLCSSNTWRRPPCRCSHGTQIGRASSQYAAACLPRGTQTRPCADTPLTPHDLRHTAASLAVSTGGNVLALARMLGDEDPSLTLRTYADLFERTQHIIFLAEREEALCCTRRVLIAQGATPHPSGGLLTRASGCSTFGGRTDVCASVS